MARYWCKGVVCKVVFLSYLDGAGVCISYVVVVGAEEGGKTYDSWPSRGIT